MNFRQDVKYSQFQQCFGYDIYLALQPD